MKAVIKNKITTDIKKVIEYITENKLNVYNGYDDTSSSFIYSFKNHKQAVKIMYDGLYDCKKTELILKPYCSKFYPKKYKPFKKRSIGLSEECKRELDQLQDGTESYEMIIWKLLLYYHGEF